MTPTRILRLDVASNTVSEFRTPKVPADFSPYVTEQVFFPSKDGTRVPMFIVRRKDVERDGNHPMLLYGYGGFNVTLTPSFSVGRSGRGSRWAASTPWPTCAAAASTARSGTWPARGARSRTCSTTSSPPAEFLIREKYTKPKTLAIQGGSNGGLLVGAVLTQRPELFGAALPDVGVLDMLRYHTASANARQWSTTTALRRRRGLQGAARVLTACTTSKPGTCYPPTLVTTADHDDRVVPWHSYKFAAALQRVAVLRQPGAAPRRDPRRARRRQAGVDADRGHRRPVRLRGECAGDAGACRLERLN